MRILRMLTLLLVLAYPSRAVATDATQARLNGLPGSIATHGSHCQHKSLSERLRFASGHRATSILGKKDEWARQLSAFDLGIRQRTTAPTKLRKFLDFASDEALEWTPEERAAWGAVVHVLSGAMHGLGGKLPEIYLVKTTGEEEFDAAYTRQRAIMLPQSLTALAAASPRDALFLLAHELFHVLSRNDPELRDRTYALLGAHRFAGIALPSELEERVLSNPDAYTYEHAVTVQTPSGPVDVVPVNQVLVPLAEAIALPSVFAALDVSLVAVHVDTSEVVRDINGELVTHSFLGSTDWATLMSRNSNYIIHPEEVLADNFATLMEWRAEGVLPVTNPFGVPINDVALLTSIEEILAGRCND